MVVDLNSNLLPKFSRPYSCNTITHSKYLKTDFDLAVAFFHCKIFQEPEKRADSDGSKGIFLDQNEFSQDYLIISKTSLGMCQCVSNPVVLAKPHPHNT